MLDIFRENPWLIVVLVGLMVPILGILLGAFSTWLWARDRRAALKTIETYVAQGKEPPPELLGAVSLGGWRHRHGAPDPTAANPGDLQEWRRDWRCHRRMGPLRAWRRAIMFGALSAGFYIAATYASGANMHNHNGLMIAAIVFGAVGVASLFSAILATVFREK